MKVASLHDDFHGRILRIHEGWTRPWLGLLGTRPSMRKQEQHSVMVKNLYVRICKIDTEREREREREIGTKKDVIIQ